MSDLNKLKKMLRKNYRDAYLSERLKGGIAYQIQAIRKATGLTQREFGKKIGKKQSVVSRLEDTLYGAVNVSTLLKVAQENDVALLVKFVSYPEFLDQTQDMSEEALRVDRVDESVNKAEAEIAAEAEAAACFAEASTSGKVVVLERKAVTTTVAVSIPDGDVSFADGDVSFAKANTTIESKWASNG